MLVSEISQLLAEAKLDTESIFRLAASRLAESIGDLCMVLVISYDGAWEDPVAIHHRDPEARELLRQVASMHRMRVGEGLNGHVMKTGEAVLLSSVSTEQIRRSVHESYRPYLDRYGSQSFLSVPLRAGGEILGSLFMSRDRDGKPYTEEDLVLVEHVAALIGLAVANARLYEATRRETDERVRAVEPLQQSQEQTGLLFRDNPLPMWVFDADTFRFLDVNDAAIMQYGFTREDFLRMRIHDIRPPEDVSPLEDHLTSARPALRPPSLWRHRRRDGSIFNVEITSHELLYENRPAVLVVAQDITERVKAEAERSRLLAKEQEARLAASTARERLEFLYGAMATLQEEGTNYSLTLRKLADSVVPALADWCAIDMVSGGGQLDRIAIVHRDSAKLMLAEDLARRYTPSPDDQWGATNVLRTGKTEFYPEISDELLARTAIDQEHLRLIKELGLRSAIVVPLVARGEVMGALTLVTAESDRFYGRDDLELCEDLARRAAMVLDNARLLWDAQQANARLELRVQERTSQLEAANRELESFAYSVSHDLRSPLRAIEGFSRILVDGNNNELDDKARDYLQRIRKNALRMGQLIDELLEFSRLSQKELRQQLVQPAEIVKVALEELAHLREGRVIDLRVHDLPSCRADPALLRQVYINLLGNALKFTKRRDVTRIDIGARMENGQAVYYVSDNGAGFDMRYVDKLFGVFQRLHRPEDYEGTGVGLAIVQRIIHRHGGTVWAEAEPEKGASFFFTLDARKDHDEQIG